MLTRIRREITKRRESVGMALVGFGLMLILITAGADDAAATAGLFSSVWPLIMKISIGLLAAAQGVKLINAGGESDADSL